jgi:isovaleryl-CoA dehydrogenase
MSESGAGSDVMSMSTVAVRDGDEYVLNGSKMWITNAPGADVMIVYARTDPRAGTKGVSAFLIERGTPGFSTPQKLDKLGMRGSDTSEVLLEDCRIPATNLMAEEGKGAAILMSGLDYERVVLAGGSLGIMAACMDLVLPYVHDRKQFGQPIGEFHVYAVAQACDRGLTTRFDAAGCILVAAEKATWMAGEAIQALGAGRLWRDAKLYEIGAGTSEIRRMLVGRELFNATK